MIIYLYSNVEKIKTIGSTFMAASGMNPSIRQVNQVLINDPLAPPGTDPIKRLIKFS